jgi:phosphate transport system substrate-binding protein
MHALLALVLLSCGAGSAAAQDAGPRPITVKGSDTVADCIGSDRVAAFETQRAGTSVRWEALGSSTAFVGLLDGSADIGVSARPIQPRELELADRLGVALEEHVLGLDAIAVIAHPSNPVSELSQEQLADLFTGEIRGWRELEGEALPVQLATLPIYSGTQALFVERLLGSDAERRKELFPEASSEYFEEPEDLVRRVASDRRYIGYVGQRFASEAPVKILGVARGSEPVQQPTPAAVRAGSYLFHRALYLYTRAAPPQRVRELVAFLLEPERGEEGEAQRCVAVERPPADQLAVAAAPSAAAAEPIRPLRIFFRSGSTRLGEQDRGHLDELLESLRAGTHTALITGHADGMPETQGGETFALERAQAIANYLKQKGAPEQSLHTEQYGESQPLAGNQLPAGREQNRRADVYLIPRGGAESQPAETASR